MIIISIFTGLFFLLWGLFLTVTPLLRRALASLAHRTAAFRYHDYVPVLVLLIAAVGLTAATGDAFIDLAELVHANSPILQETDARVHDWVSTRRESPVTTLFFVFFTQVGSPVGLASIVLAVAVWLFMRGRYRWMAYLLLTTGVGALLNVELKRYFARARPDLAVALRKAHGYSFPSGHAMGSMVVAGALAYLAFRALPGNRSRAAAMAGALTFALAVASSRVYLGVHWTSDIFAGMSAGLIWVVAATVAYETTRRIRLIRSRRRKTAQSVR